MLEFYCRAANRLVAFRAAYILLFVINIGFICYALIFPDSAAFDVGLLPALLTFLWLLLLFLFCQMFGSVGDLTTQSKGLLKKSKQKLKRFIYGSFALLFSLLSIAVVLLSIRSLNVWLQT
ncbi:hypothetical protein [Thalassotalea atypica]|uniref:hypothetical protein n=1 Tax=Thalassotalea atypica TaxID=2054316 RepID=UPI002574145E|nr:hypothetical protein [Thalassotalea atypica]